MTATDDARDTRAADAGERSAFGILLSMIAWTAAGAVCAGGCWAGVLVISRVQFGLDLFALVYDLRVEIVRIFAGVGALSGLATGVLVGLIRDRREMPDLSGAIAWGIGGVLTGASGGAAAPLVVSEIGTAIHPEISSSLAWAAAGALAGLGGRLLSWCMNEAPEPDDVDDEEVVARPPTPGTAAVELRRPTPRDLPIALRFLPALLVSVAALVAAALVDSRDAAVALLAVGLLGLSVVPVLRNQERRLRQLERRFHGEPRLGHE